MGPWADKVFQFFKNCSRIREQGSLKVGRFLWMDFAGTHRTAHGQWVAIIVGYCVGDPNTDAEMQKTMEKRLGLRAPGRSS